MLRAGPGPNGWQPWDDGGIPLDLEDVPPWWLFPLLAAAALTTVALTCWGVWRTARQLADRIRHPSRP